MPPSPAASPTPPSPADAPSFESAMERLETIVGQMENARLPLEELIRCYEEGTRLVQVCSERLHAAEQRIEMITRDASGQARTAEVTAQTIGAEAAAAPAVPAATPAKSSRAARSTASADQPATPAAATPADEPSAAATGRGPSAKNRHEVSLF